MNNNSNSTTTQEQQQEYDCKPAAVVVTPERAPPRKKPAAAATAMEEVSSVLEASASASASASHSRATGQRPRGPLTKEEWLEKWKNDKEFRLSEIYDMYFWDVLRLAWPEHYYFGPAVVDEQDKWDEEWKTRSSGRQAAEAAVEQFLEHLDDSGLTDNVQELAWLCEPPLDDDDDDQEEPDWRADLQKAVTWDTSSRFEHLLTVLHLISIMGCEELGYMMDEAEDENPNMTGSQVTALLRERFQGWKDFWLDYYKCPWSTLFLDENEQKCSGEDKGCKWMVFPKGYTMQDYERAWELEKVKQPSKSNGNDEPDTKRTKIK